MRCASERQQCLQSNEVTSECDFLDILSLSSSFHYICTDNIAIIAKVRSFIKSTFPCECLVFAGIVNFSLPGYISTMFMQKPTIFHSRCYTLYWSGGGG